VLTVSVTGPATDLAHQAADKLGDAAQWLEGRDPGSLVEEVRNLARRKPGAFLLGAAAAGVLAGRLTRGAVQASRNDSQSSGSYNGGSTYADRTTAPSGTTTPQSGSFAGESYPAGETEVLVVEENAVSSTYGAGAR